MTSPAAPSAKPPAKAKMTRAEALRAAEQHLRRGRELFSAGHVAQSLAEYQQVRRLDPTNQDVGYLLGLAYEQVGQPEAALKAYRSCTSGTYALIARNHVKRLEKKLGVSR
jgi:Flp pilus assembly protein TadD